MFQTRVVPNPSPAIVNRVTFKLFIAYLFIVTRENNRDSKNLNTVEHKFAKLVKPVRMGGKQAKNNKNKPLRSLCLSNEQYIVYLHLRNLLSG
jgi:hypothetical protein